MRPASNSTLLVSQRPSLRYTVIRPGWPAAWNACCTSRYEQGRYESPYTTKNASPNRSEEHTSELQSLRHLVCRLLLEKKNNNINRSPPPSTHSMFLHYKTILRDS